MTSPSHIGSAAGRRSIGFVIAFCAASGLFVVDVHYGGFQIPCLVWLTVSVLVNCFVSRAPSIAWRSAERRTCVAILIGSIGTWFMFVNRDVTPTDVSYIEHWTVGFPWQGIVRVHSESPIGGSGWAGYSVSLLPGIGWEPFVFNASIWLGAGFAIAWLLPVKSLRGAQLVLGVGTVGPAVGWVTMMLETSTLA